MIDLPADIEDRAAYPLVAVSERWIFNKLLLAEALGYDCGPCGTPVTKAGVYCVRPIMNCAGNGIGGVMKYPATVQGRGFTQPPFAAGYFWCDWFEGWHGWTDFTDDLPTDECGGVPGPRRFDYMPHLLGQPFVLDALPVLLQGLSKHLLVEHIGGKIIEVSPRHMPWIHGRGTSYMEKYRPKAAWAGLDEAEPPFYWRIFPKT